MTISTDSNHARFSILSSFENVANLAEEVSVYCGSIQGTSSESVDLLRLCVAEALNNVVEHAYSGQDGKPIFAEVSISNDKYQVLIIDEGRPMPKDGPPDANLDFDLDDIENLPEGGFGWMLIREQMDTVDYERREGHNVLRLEKRRDH